MARARAMDTDGRSQPEAAMPRTRGHLVDAVVRHLVTEV